MKTTLEWTRALIQRPSVTPDDQGCQDLMAEELEALGFACETLQVEEVTNLWARRGTAGPLIVFAGHTDVVPTGPAEAWNTPPFEPTEIDGLLFGRGSADMKGSLAAMLVATRRFLATDKGRHFGGSLAFLITSDEEGPAKHGTRAVVERLGKRGVQIDYCIVGEPSSGERFADTVRVGRRGSLNGYLDIEGVQGHVAYPDDASNPIHAVLPALAELAGIRWDEGYGPFPPTGFQISNLNAGVGADNVIPGTARIHFNFRFSPAQTASKLQERVEGILDRHLRASGAHWQVRWALSGEPFLTDEGELIQAVRRACAAQDLPEPDWSTSGGTSDGRFIAPTGAQVIELGPGNATIHKVDECVSVTDLNALTDLYAGVLDELAEAPAPNRND